MLLSLCLGAELAAGAGHQPGAQQPGGLPEEGPGHPATQDEGGDAQEQHVVAEQQPEVLLPLQTAEQAQQVELGDSWHGK